MIRRLWLILLLALAGLQPALAAPPPIVSINPDGYSARWRSHTPPTLVPASRPIILPLIRQGFTATGAATTYVDKYIVTARIRDVTSRIAAPVLSPTTVALSDWVCKTDFIPGVVNNSTLDCPAPVANWVHGSDHRVVGNSLHLEFVAFQMFGRAQAPVVGGQCTVTDGTTTLTVPAVGKAGALPGVPETLTSSTDQGKVLGYTCDFDITSLASGQITANAKVWPWIGSVASGSVADSSLGSNANRGFVPQVFTKRTTNPYYAYVALSTATPAGNDSSCVASQTAATAAASPCLTPEGSIAKLFSTAGLTDGHIVRVTAGTFVIGPVGFGSTSATNAAVIIERDPATTAGTAILSFGSANNVQRQKYMLFRNLAFTRTGTFNIPLSTAGGHVGVENCTLNAANGSSSGVFDRPVFYNGLTSTNETQGTFQPITNEIRLFRGVVAGTAAWQQAIDNFLVVGSALKGASLDYSTTLGMSGTIIAFNDLREMGGVSKEPLKLAGTAVASFTGVAIVQNSWEWTAANSTVGFAISNDEPKGTSLSHVLMWHNSMTGFGIAGRVNMFYDSNAAGTVRTHGLTSIVGNIFSSLNIKGIEFVNRTQPGDANNHIGNIAQIYGVGMRDNMTEYADAETGGLGGAFNFAFPGLRANLGTSLSVRNDPLFTFWGGVTGTATPSYTAGVTGTDFTLQSGSPAKGVMPFSILPRTLAGTARPATGDNLGAH